MKKVKARRVVTSVSSNHLKFSEFYYFEAHTASVQISVLIYIRVAIIFPIATAHSLCVSQLTLSNHFCMDYKYYCNEKIERNMKEWKEIACEWTETSFKNQRRWFCYIISNVIRKRLFKIILIFHNCPAFGFHAISLGFQHAITGADQLPLQSCVCHNFIIRLQCIFFSFGELLCLRWVLGIVRKAHHDAR